MHDYNKRKRYVDESFEIELPKDLCEKLSIEIKDEVHFHVDDDENIIMRKPLKLSKAYMTQQRIAELARKYTKMECIVFQNCEVLVSTASEVKLGDKVKLIEKTEKTLFSSKEKKPEFILEKADKYTIKKVFRLVHYETDLGYLAIIDKSRDSIVKAEIYEMLSELTRFAVGDTYEKL